MRTITVLFLLISQALSSASQYALQHYSIEEGLSQSTVYDLFLDSDGYLWCATQDGISKFDGMEFQNFSTKQGLINERVLSMNEDQSHQFWIGTLSNGIYYKKNGRVFPFPYNDQLSSKNINDIATRNHLVWFATDSGVIQYDKTSNKIQSKNICKKKVNSFAIGEDTVLWIGCDRGLHYLVNDTIYHFQNSVLDKLHINKLFFSSEKDLWIGTLDGGVYVLDSDRSLRDLKSPNELANNTITEIIEDKKERVLIGSDGGGIEIYENKVLSTKVSEKQGLINSNILSLTRDWEENIWVGYFGGGVSCLTRKGFTSYDTQNGIAGNIIFDITEDDNNAIWFAAYGDGLSKLKNGKFTNYTQKNGLISDKISDFSYHENKLWLCSDRGLTIFYPGTPVVHYSMENGLSHRQCESVAFSQNDTVWLGTRAGLCYLHKGEIFSIDHPILSKARILKVLKSQSNGLWIGTAQFGAFNFDSMGKIKQYTMKEGMAHNNVFDIFEDSHQRTWFATDYGVSFLANHIITSFHTDDGLSNDLCYFIAEDDDENIWIGTNYGVNKLNLQDTSFTTYTSRDGLASNEMNSGACYKDKTGKLWFGTIKGMTCFDPSHDIPVLTPPKIHIKNAVIGNEKIVKSGLIFNYKNNRVQINFAGISYNSPLSITYKYKLDGLEKNWHMSKYRSVQYASLPPGEYTFLIKAINKDGVSSKKTAAFSFEISPPFWKSPIFIIIGILFSISLIYFRIYSFRHQKFELEKTIARRTREITEQKNRLEFANIKLTRLSKKLETASKTDPLTNLSNRRDAQQKLDYEFLRYERTLKPFSIIMCDIDHFKRINDTYGHDCGDYILKAMSLIFKNTLRKMDIVSRWGGEEFLIILPETDKKGAATAAEKLRKRIHYNKFKYETTMIQITISIGVATFAPTLSISEVIKEADDNLYRAKKQGRDQVVSSTFI